MGMSAVCAVSPSVEQLLGKRSRYSEEQDYFDCPSKRGRASLSGSPARRAALVQLHFLYPSMAERDLAAVLEACDDDVEAAIRRLDELKLSAAHGGEQRRSLDVHAAAAQPESPAAAEPSVASRYVDSLVQEMACSKDVQEARQRASRVLEQLEGEVRGACDRKTAETRGQMEAAVRDNCILKRAVAIQNTRHQEFAAAAETENQELRRQLARCQEELHSAQLNNYSLSLHLREAMSSTSFPNQRNPDVF